MKVLWFCFTVALIFWLLHMLDMRRIRKGKIRDAARRESEKRIMMPPEGSTPEDQKRLVEQMEVGDPIFRMLHNEWKLAGKPSAFRVWRNSNIRGIYWIGISSTNGSGDPAIVAITIDTRRLQDRVISVETRGQVKTFPTTEASMIKNIVTEHQIFWD